MRTKRFIDVDVQRRAQAPRIGDVLPTHVAYAASVQARRRHAVTARPFHPSRLKLTRLLLKRAPLCELKCGFFLDAIARVAASARPALRQRIARARDGPPLV